MKRIFSLLTALVMVCSLPLHAHAETSEFTEYFRLMPSNNRITDDGIFEIRCRVSSRSNHNFIATSYSIPLTVSAQIYSDDPSQAPRNANNIYYTIKLYKVGVSAPVGEYTHAANGQTGSTSFAVSTGSEYYLTIEITGATLGTWEYVFGYGDISNIYLV